MKYTAEMKHNEETIQRLVVTQYNTFQFEKKIIRAALALLLIVIGLYVRGPYIMPWVCLILGCVLIAGLNMRPRHNANNICRQMNGKFPYSKYSFEEEGFRFFKQGDLIPYSKLIKLVEDKEYIYLYISSESAYMIDKSTVRPGTAEELKTFLAKKTAMQWTRPNSFLRFRFTSIFERFARANEFKGERLK